MASPVSLSIFLLRQGRESDYDSGIGDSRASRVELRSLNGYFSPVPAELRTPRWVSAINSILASPTTSNLQSQSPAGLLLIRRGTRTFILTFGHAWMKLQLDWLERDFGRRVALNLIGESDIVEIRAEQVFARWHLASERAPRATSVDEFGVEFDRDLVAVVEGKSSDPIFGKIVRGGTSLRCTSDFATLPDILDRSLIQFASTEYKKRWPDIDNLSPVTDLTTIAALEQQLDSDLAAGRGSKRVVLSSPSQRSGEALAAASYVVGRLSKNPASTPYLTFAGWEGYAKRSKIPISVDSAKKTRVHLLDENAVETAECSAFDCFGYEASLNNQPHILSSGVWYEAVPAFVSKIDRSVTSLPAPTTKLLPWNGTDEEGVYNLGCATHNSTLLHFDAKNVWYGGGGSRFEFCDLMHLPSKTLFFAKNPLRSAHMSHLVEQVRRTAGLFFNPDPAFRRALDKKVTKHYPKLAKQWRASRPLAGEWTLCFVSLGRTAKDLPFFAKCSLANACSDLRRIGHKVAFLKV
jgi:uncharacterized protein (TIGR04141 family)